MTIKLSELLKELKQKLKLVEYTDDEIYDGDNPYFEPRDYYEGNPDKKTTDTPKPNTSGTVTKPAKVEEFVSHGSQAKSSREKKEKNPENYCKSPGCLWRTKDRNGDNPCKKHGSSAPKVDPNKPAAMKEDVKDDANALGWSSDAWDKGFGGESKAAKQTPKGDPNKPAPLKELDATKPSKSTTSEPPQRDKPEYDEHPESTVYAPDDYGMNETETDSSLSGLTVDMVDRKSKVKQGLLNLKETDPSLYERLKKILGIQ